jgi:site-specific recombinase XerD
VCAGRPPPTRSDDRTGTSAVTVPFRQHFIHSPVPEVVTMMVIAPVAVTQAPKENSEARVRRVKQYIETNRNKNTKAAYASGMAGFRKYLERVGVRAEQVKEAEIADYLRERVEEQDVAASTVNGDRAAIADYFRHTPQHQYVSGPLVTNLMALLKTKATQSKPKRHVSGELMTDILRTHERRRKRQLSAAGSMSKKDQVEMWREERDVCLLFTMMAGMLRESEAAKLTIGNVRIKEHTLGGKARKLMELAIVESKTDQAKNGALVLIGTNEDPELCPVTRMEIYLEARRALGLNSGPEEPLFCKQDGTAMAKVTPCGIMQRKVEEMNEREFQRDIMLTEKKYGEPLEYGSHSLRRGGVTATRANGVSMLDIQAHGRWKSLTVFAYVGRTSEEQLSVTNAFLSPASGMITGVNPVLDRVPSISSVQLRKAEKAMKAVTPAQPAADFAPSPVSTPVLLVQNEEVVTEPATSAKKRKRKARGSESESEEDTEEDQREEALLETLRDEANSQGYGSPVKGQAAKEEQRPAKVKSAKEEARQRKSDKKKEKKKLLKARAVAASSSRPEAREGLQRSAKKPNGQGSKRQKRDHA